jgi:hypothetical protein
MSRYYRLDEANERLAELRPLLQKLREDRDEVAEIQQKIRDLRAHNGNSDHAVEMARLEDEMRVVVAGMAEAVEKVDGWGIALRDIGTGLIDFPALANGRPIWLCWRLGEDDLNWWHESDQGFDSRRRLTELS